MDYIDRSILGPAKTEYINQLATKIKNIMNPSLFEHSLSTMEFALEMAGSGHKDVDLYRLSVASLAHA